MKTKLIALAAVFAALGSPTFAQDESYGAPVIKRSYSAAAPHRTGAMRGAYDQTPVQSEPEFYNNGWVAEGAFDHSRPGGIDSDLRPTGN